MRSFTIDRLLYPSACMQDKYWYMYLYSDRWVRWIILHWLHYTTLKFNIVGTNRVLLSWNLKSKLILRTFSHFSWKLAAAIYFLYFSYCGTISPSITAQTITTYCHDSEKLERSHVCWFISTCHSQLIVLGKILIIEHSSSSNTIYVIVNNKHLHTN